MYSRQRNSGSFIISLTQPGNQWRITECYKICFCSTCLNILSAVQKNNIYNPGFPIASIESLFHVLPSYLQAAVTEEDKERLLTDLQKKVTSLERRLQGNLSQDDHLQELLQEVKNI